MYGNENSAEGEVLRWNGRFCYWENLNYMRSVREVKKKRLHQMEQVREDLRGYTVGILGPCYGGAVRRLRLG